MMHTSPTGISLIKSYEEFAARRYLCPAKKWTIGWGHVITPAEWPTLADATLTEAQGEAIMADDLRYFEDQVRRAVTVPLTQGQFDALVSIVFNVGPGAPGVRDGIIWLKSGKPSTLLARLNAGDYAAAAAQFPNWKFCGGNVLAGLVRRRAAERALFEPV
jgi:lysozyme